MSDTPRTDAIRERHCSEGEQHIGLQYVQLVQHAEAIERELAEARKSISDGVPKWIPVSERLPERHTAVLAIGFNFSNPVAGRWFNVLRRVSERSDIGWEATGLGAVVPPTHWMPLPEAPK